MFSFLSKLFGCKREESPEQLDRMGQIKSRARGTNEIGLDQLKKESKSVRPSSRPAKAVVMPERKTPEPDPAARDASTKREF